MIMITDSMVFVVVEAFPKLNLDQKLNLRQNTVSLEQTNYANPENLRQRCCQRWRHLEGLPSGSLMLLSNVVVTYDCPMLLSNVLCPCPM